MTNLVTLIIPVYNVDKYLERCIESVLNQSYKNLEIILINDGSTDRSGEICDSYGRRDKRIIVIHKSNGGLSSARNTGLDLSSGEYIGFIDSDDWIEYDFVESLHRLILTEDADISQCTFVNDNGIDTHVIVRDENYIVIDREQCLRNLANKNTYLYTVVAWNKLYKRDVFKNLRYKVGVVFEDEAIAHEIYCSINKVAYSKSPLYHYFRRPGSITKSNFSMKNLDALSAIENRIIFFKDKNENKLASLFQPVFFRTLLNLLSKMDNNDLKMEFQSSFNEISKKLDQNLEQFIKSNNFDFIDKILLRAYIFNPKLGFIFNNILSKLSKIKN